MAAEAPLDLPSPEQRRRTLELFRAVAHEDRLLVLLALSERPRLCVAELTALCGASQSAMSHQLRTLRDAGLVRAERAGRHVFYALDDHHVAQILADAVTHVAETPLFSLSGEADPR